MIIDCDASVHTSGSRPRFSRAKVGVGLANGHAYLVVVTQQYKEKLKLIGNCTIRPATLSFKSPNKEVFIKNAGELMLKAIMAIIKKIVDKKEMPKLSKVTDIEKQKPLATSLNIKGGNVTQRELNNKCLNRLIATQMKPIPNSVWSLKNLVELRLTESSLKEIPRGMLSLKCLKILDLSKNRLEFLDATLFVSLRSLAYLNLSHNQLNFLPFEVFALQHLTELNISDNKLEYLHYTFARLGKRLKVLNLSNNAMVRFPIVLTGPTFRFNKVDVSGNPFSNQMKQVICNATDTTIPSPTLSLQQLCMMTILKNDNLLLTCHQSLPPLLYRNLQMSSEVCSSCDSPIANMSLTSPIKSDNAFSKYSDIVECLITSSNYLPVLAFNCVNCKTNQKSKTTRILTY